MLSQGGRIGQGRQADRFRLPRPRLALDDGWYVGVRPVDENLALK
jgi:hypothetical protein